VLLRLCFLTAGSVVGASGGGGGDAPVPPSVPPPPGEGKWCYGDFVLTILTAACIGGAEGVGEAASEVIREYSANSK
jgi:hypothetical protein